MTKATDKDGPAAANRLAAAGRFLARHKLAAGLAVLLVAGAGLALRLFMPGRAASGSGGSYSFIRTTVLTRGSLDETVSVTGTVESADTSSVTYSSAGAGTVPKIKAVHAAVGDAVKAGDVIVTLDTADILESIAKEKEALAEQTASAQESYDEAAAAYSEAEATAVAYESTVAEAKTAYETAKAAYDAAAASVAAYQTDYDTKLSAQQTAGAACNNASTALDAANRSWQAARQAANAEPENAALAAAAQTAQAALEQAQAEADAAGAAYEKAVSAAEESQRLLEEKKQVCGYESLSQQYQQASQSYETARSTLDRYEESVTSCQKQLTQAKEQLEKAATSDTLESLYDQLDACELKAETSGKVTALNARVGDTPSGAVATIQDTDSLKISVTIPESDINNVAVGMACRITSDATEGEIAGTLTQIDPVAGQNGGFGAEVTVSGGAAGLLIGMNAAVEIVQSSTSDCFTVPLDAVGNDDDGLGDYVYRQTGGEGVDMTFEKVYVTTGAQNDYYTEISGGDLAEGDVIRASADLTQGLETVTGGGNGQFSFDMPGGAVVVENEPEFDGQAMGRDPGGTMDGGRGGGN